MKDDSYVLDEDGNYPEPEDYAKENKKQTPEAKKIRPLDNYVSKKPATKPTRQATVEEFGA